MSNVQKSLEFGKETEGVLRGCLGDGFHVQAFDSGDVFTAQRHVLWLVPLLSVGCWNGVGR